MKRTIRRTYGLTLALLGMPWVAQADELEKSWWQAGDFETASNQAVFSPADAAREAGIGLPPPLSPPHPVGQDAFGGLRACQVIDVKFGWLPSRLEALKMLAPCMRAVSHRYGVSVWAAESLIPGGGRRRGVAGIGIHARGPLPLGSNVLVDLQRAVDIVRYGKILTYRAQVRLENGGETRPRLSSLQGVVDDCASRIRLGPGFGTDLDFIEIFGPCLKAAKGLGITRLALPPDLDLEGKGSVSVFSRAEEDAVDRMNGSVIVSGGSGPKTFRIWAYRDIQ